MENDFIPVDVEKLKQGVKLADELRQKHKIPTWEEQRYALREAKDRGDKPIEVNCIWAKKWKIMKDKRITVSTIYPARPENFHEYPVIMVYNEKWKSWKAEPLVEYKSACPVCLKLMLVRAIAGTTWLACCSKKCYEKYDNYRKEKG